MIAETLFREALNAIKLASLILGVCYITGNLIWGIFYVKGRRQKGDKC